MAAVVAVDSSDDSSSSDDEELEVGFNRNVALVGRQKIARNAVRCVTKCLHCASSRDCDMCTVPFMC